MKSGGKRRRNGKEWEEGAKGGCEEMRKGEKEGE
jgi:hypothetical protein